MYEPSYAFQRTTSVNSSHQYTRRYSMKNTTVEFDSKNRPTHDYLATASMNVVIGTLGRKVPDYIIPKED